MTITGPTSEVTITASELSIYSNKLLCDSSLMTVGISGIRQNTRLMVAQCTPTVLSSLTDTGEMKIPPELLREILTTLTSQIRSVEAEPSSWFQVEAGRDGEDIHIKILLKPNWIRMP